MTKALQEIVGYETLTGAILDTTMGIPFPFPESFRTAGGPRKVVADKARFFASGGERRTAKYNAYGSPAHRFDLKKADEIPLTLLHSFAEMPINPLIFKALRAKESYELDSQLDHVKHQISSMAERFQNLRKAVIGMMLNAGVVYFDINGNLLPSSSSAHHTVDFNMSANNQSQLNSIISASWALNNTNIPLQLANLKKRAARLTGYPLKYAFYGENILTYFSANAYVEAYMARHEGMRGKFLETNELPDGLFGLMWKPAYEVFYEDADGTNQDIWGADDVTFCPEPAPYWYEFVEGSYEVPSSVNIVGDPESVMSQMKTVHGMFGFGVASFNPPSVQSFYGDTFLSNLKNPNCLYQADVTP